MSSPTWRCFCDRVWGWSVVRCRHCGASQIEAAEFRKHQNTGKENERLRQDLRQAKRVIWCLVKQCGGEVELSVKDLREAETLTIISEPGLLVRLRSRERAVP